MTAPIGYLQLSHAGRLGNQLWEIASTIGIARAQGAEPVFPLWDYQPFFCVPEAMFREFPGPRGREVLCQPATWFVAHMDDRAKPYLQDYGLWRDVEAEIREYFEPSPMATRDYLTGLWEHHQLGDLDGIVAVHIRRGDNVTHPEGYHPLRSWDYYRDALSGFDAGDNIVVFSDDAPWCREHFEAETGRQPVFFYEGVSRPREYADRAEYENAEVLDWVDLQLMAACDHHVISNSTYAWWGAFLSDDPAPIYPSNWFGWRIREWTDASLMFPDHWVQVDDPTMGGV